MSLPLRLIAMALTTQMCTMTMVAGNRPRHVWLFESGFWIVVGKQEWGDRDIYHGTEFVWVKS